MEAGCIKKGSEGLGEGIRSRAFLTRLIELVSRSPTAEFVTLYYNCNNYGDESWPLSSVD